MSIKGFEVGGVQERYDYTALDNIPANLVQDANYVHTDNNYTNADKTKLSGIEAQANKTTIDATLTHSGQAADAKATGDELEDLKSAFTANLIHDTATGSIANFPDGAAMPVRDLSVDIEPVQDLHGYDNPWPAGGGKNLFPLPITAETKNGVTVEATTSGEIWVHGTPTIASGYISFSLPQITSAITGNKATISINEKVVGIGFDTNIGGGVLTFSMSDTLTVKTGLVNAINGAVTVNVRFDVGTVDKKFKIQLELGSSETAWTPYSNICPISGWTGAKVVRTGVNVWDGVAESGYINVNTGEELSSESQRRSLFVSCKPSTNYVYVNTNAASGVRIAFYDGAKNYVGMFSNNNSNPQSFTTPQNAKYLRFYWGDTSGISINYPSTDTAYEPYQGDTYSITFPTSAGTVYGGTLDVTQGKLTVDRAMVDIGTLTWTSISNNRKQCTELTNSIAKPTSTAEKVNLIAERYANVNASDLFSDSSLIGISVNISGYLIARTNGEEVSGKLVYELATPIVYDLTPTEVTTLLGTNNIFADCGDSTVDYYADPTLYISKKIAAAVAAMS